MNSAAEFFRGFICPFKGFIKVISSFRLMALAILPFWFCFLLGIYLLVRFWGSFPYIAPYALAYVPGLFEFTQRLKIGEFSLLGAIMQGVFWVFLVIFISYFAYILLSIVGAPFYSLLTDDILRSKGARPLHSGGFWHWLYTTLKMLVINVLKLGFFMALGFVFFFFSFIPVGMMVVPFLMALLIAYDCFDFSFECMNMSLTRRYRFFKTHFFAFLGLSLTIVLIGSIPGLFTLMLPFFVAGGADLFSDLHTRNLNEQRIIT